VKHREDIIHRWFTMWLRAQDTGIAQLFTEDAVYIESWGPEYHGADQIGHWFREWNTRGRVLRWEIKQFFHSDTQTAVVWYFQNAMHDGTVEAFDGVSLVRWAADGRICFLQEFGCNENRYNPYAHGDAPEFRAEKARWF